MLWLLLASCGPGRDRLVVYVEPDQVDLIDEFFVYVPWEHVEIVPVDDPEAEAAKGSRATRIAVVPDLDCTECYQLDGEPGAFVVHGGAPLGVQYGLSHLLEEMGFHFWHPYAPVAPLELQEVDPAALGVLHEPEMARRGLHLHTLHPIEGMDAFWIPSEQGRDEASRVIDWVVKNRGNHLQWVGLDDISNPATQAAWEESTVSIVDEAHERGLTVGLGIQLFGRANLQLAWDLLDDVGTAEEQEVAIEAKLDQIDAVPWDVLNLSFGEFFGEDPDTFIASTNLAYSLFQARWPGVDVTTTIHVGNYEDLRIEYQGQEVLYYFLVQFADPELVPWIHSVMFYDLFEDAGGAYLHDEFDEHREFLLERLRAGEPIGYFPESAYWVAFDNSVPLYYPLYVRSRWVDLRGIRDVVEAEGIAPLQDHVLFSSGWEWGYWQGDAATLRMTYELPADWRDSITDLFASDGEDGERLAAGVSELVDVQHDYVLEQRLAGYLCGRDSIIDFGETQGIVSQPNRYDFDEIVAMEPAARATFAVDVVDALGGLGAATRAVYDGLPEATDDDRGRYVQEIRDGTEVDALRAEFAEAVWRAAVVHGDGGDAQPHLERARLKMAEGRRVAGARADAFHDPDGERWIDPAWENPTLYDYGYLFRADELCFWDREYVEITNLVNGTDVTVPGCAL